jgi:UDP-N-acetylmuramoylalanine--D-glutamate ligase
MTNAKIIVWGLGVTGLASIEFALKQGHKILAIDQRLPLVASTLSRLNELKSQYGNLSWDEQSALSRPEVINDTQAILLSPGIPREHEFLKAYHQKNIPVLNEIEWAAKLFKGPIIAITGSNGKTTTTLLTAHLLKGLGLRVFAGGNLGRPFVDYFNKEEQADIAVLELSSFQCESLFEFNAHSAALLNLSFTHAERYCDVLSYAEAKMRLTSMSSRFWLCSEYDHPELKSLWAKAEDLSHVRSLRLEMNQLNEIYDLSDFTLFGKHNLMNLWSATCLILDVYPEQRARLRQALKGFMAPEHRLEPVKSHFSKRLILNDSKSTNPIATITALKAFEGNVDEVMLILGGKCRGGNDSLLPHWDELKKHFKTIAFYGESAKVHTEELHSLGAENRLQYSCFGLEDLLKALKDQETPNIWIFSPGFPSFDQFLNYEDRGRHFKKWIKELSL